MSRQTQLSSEATYPFWIRENIRNADTDQFQHVNNAAIASYCEAGRMSLFSEPSLREQIGGLNIVVVKLTILFVKELFYPGEVQVGTRVTSIGNTSFEVSQGLYGSEGRFATSEATCVMIDRAQRMPSRIPEAVRTLFAQHGSGISRS